MHFGIHIFSILGQYVMFSVYFILRGLLEKVEECCWHVDNLMDCQAIARGHPQLISGWIRVLHYIICTIWKVLMRICAVVLILYTYCAESPPTYTFSGFPALACLGEDGPSFDFNLN